jgi:HPt (histidine-containing phosphotransfer) domain-containing protein
MVDHAADSLNLMPSPPMAGDEAVIDVAHLGRMTLGDRKLELQVLGLFDRQAELLLARMQEVDPAGVASLAHTLCGSARGIGAWRVAAAAEALEQAVAAGHLPPALAHLAATVEETRLAIASLVRIAAPA